LSISKILSSTGSNIEDFTKFVRTDEAIGRD
jgi:hypothetical protein